MIHEQPQRRRLEIAQFRKGNGSSNQLYLTVILTQYNGSR